MTPRYVLTSAIAGLVWGALATAVFWAMFRGTIPAPADAGMPTAILLVAAALPFQAAMAVEALASRSSPGLAEVVGLTILCGVMLVLVLGWILRTIGVVRRA